VAAPSALAAPSASAPALSQDAIDAARKTALWMFVSLLIGAFTASWLATIGGRQRDRFE
jgi:Mg/Co/Ni transporter MgtE